MEQLKKINLLSTFYKPYSSVALGYNKAGCRNEVYITER